MINKIIIVASGLLFILL